MPAAIAMSVQEHNYTFFYFSLVTFPKNLVIVLELFSLCSDLQFLYIVMKISMFLLNNICNKTVYILPDIYYVFTGLILVYMSTFWYYFVLVINFAPTRCTS